MTRAVIWDFDRTLGRRSGRWSDTLVEILDTECPGHGVTASSLMPGLSRGFPWHDPDRAHPELAAGLLRLRGALPGTTWHLTGSGGAVFALAAGPSEAEAVAARARALGFTARACRTVAV